MRVTPLLLVARALLSAVRHFPDINARWDEENQEIVHPRAVNLGIAKLDVSGFAGDVPITVVERTGRGDRDPVDAVLDEIDERGATRLVIAVRRRSLVSKAVLGSVSQRLILNAPIPVLAVKAD